MKLLLDENLPHDLRHHLIGHDVFTVYFMGWSSLSNGELLAQAAHSGFYAMLTLDNSVQYQQNLATLPISIVILRCDSNDLADVLPLVPRLIEVLAKLDPKTIAIVP